MNYTIKWTQVYNNWVNPIDEYIESVLQYNDFSEALKLIERIKNL